MIYALQYHIPKLAETKIYVDPPGGHSFDRLVNKEKTAPQNTPPQRDSWNRIWTFLEANLKPYIGVAGKIVEGEKRVKPTHYASSPRKLCVMSRFDPNVYSDRADRRSLLIS